MATTRTGLFSVTNCTRYPLGVRFGRRSAQILSSLPSATVTPANAEPAVSSARRPPFPASPLPSRALARSTFVSETRAQDSDSPSAPHAGRRSSTSRKGTSNASPYPSEPSRTHTSRPRQSRYTRSAGTRGSPFPTSSAGVRIQSSPAPSGELSTLPYLSFPRNRASTSSMARVVTSCAMLTLVIPAKAGIHG